MKRLFFAIGLMCLASIAFAETVNIPDGDVEALVVAFNDPKVDTVELAKDGLYPMETRRLVVTQQKTLVGNGAKLKSKSGVNALIHIESNGVLNLENIVLANASRGVLNHGALYGSHVMFENHYLGVLPGEEGGAALLNMGTAVLEDSEFHRNSARGENFSGGAVDNRGDLTINRSVFAHNKVGRYGGKVEGATGIDLFNRGRAKVTNTQFYGGHGWWGVYIVDMKPVHHSVVNADEGQMLLKHVSIIGQSNTSPGSRLASGDAVLNMGKAHLLTLVNSYVTFLPKSNVTTQGVNVARLLGSENTAGVFVHPEIVYSRRLPVWEDDRALAGLLADSPLVDGADQTHCTETDITGRLRDDLCDVGAFEWRAEDLAANTAGMSGSWVLEGERYDKEGLLIEALPEGQMQVFHLGYDGAEPAWLLGQSKVTQGMLSIDLSKPKVSHDNPPLFGSALTIAPFEMSYPKYANIAFIDCNHAVMTDQWSGWVHLRRLTVPKNMIGCGGMAEVSQFTQKRRIDSGISGSWYPPQYPGQGLFIEVLPGNKIQAFYFGYPKEQPKSQDERINQMVLIAHGDVRGQFADLDAYTVASKMTGSGYERFVKNWGTMTLKFNSCNDAEVWFDGVDGKDYLKLKRLTSWAGNSCK